MVGLVRWTLGQVQYLLVEECSVVTKVSDRDGMVMVYVPEGRFIVESNESTKSVSYPEHSIILAPFWIDQTEVTNAMYRFCVEQGVCKNPEGTYYGDQAYHNYPASYWIA
jgi:formylglycine-generating enzyme required for sulfatase activity